MDAGLLGLGEWGVHMARRLLGTARGLLRRRELRLRLYGNRICGRHVGQWRVPLQHGRDACEYDGHPQHICGPDQCCNATTIANDRHVLPAYSGGPGGINHPATAQENQYSHESHTAPTSYQTQHESAARTNVNNYASHNGGHPTNAATDRPLAGGGRGPAAGGNHTNTPNPSAGSHNPGAGNPGAPNDRTYNASHSNTGNHPAPAVHTMPENRPAAPSHTAPGPQTREPQPTHENRPAPVDRPAPQTHEPRPAPENRPAPQSHAGPPAGGQPHGGGGGGEPQGGREKGH